ncbi:MAG TPA: pitrilysin family protein, partial [Candidatus Bathyarchaeia archaeon]|nr:pitrilysin family protein [Candidatus Bathyarchaeia archaeon]
MGLDTDLPKLIQEQEANPGVRCLFYQTSDNPTVAIHGSILAGTSSEKPTKSGIAELTTRLLIRGTRKLAATRIADLLESVGAAITFRNSQDSIVFQARVTSDWTKRVLGVLADCLVKPALSPADVAREKEGLLTDIRLRDDDTTRRGMRELLQLVYPSGHPYRRDRFGTAESVKKIERSDVKTYFDDVVSRSQALVAFAGHFKKDVMLNWTKRTFGERNKERTNRITTVSDPPVATQKELVMPHKTQADILVG